MGLEFLDIHFRIEKRFGISLPADEMLGCVTVGDLADAIEKRVAAARQATCVMLPAFLETRNFVREFLNAPLISIRPSTLITTVIPTRQRKAFWAALREWYGSYPSSLRLHTPYRWAYFLLTIFALYLAAFNGWYGIVAAYFLVVAMVVARRFLPLVPPRGFTTFGDVARRRASVNTAIAKDIGAVDVLAALQHEMSCALGLEASKLHRDARLRDDLEIG
ncbi:acyl carrier protein [Lacipirellula sp.]|uniref:acyl carrier protein n=1 Tax=Lacipirellula sp. TaxID=2691419 RepID=UPI003D0AF8C6